MVTYLATFIWAIITYFVFRGGVSIINGASTMNGVIALIGIAVSAGILIKLVDMSLGKFKGDK